MTELELELTFLAKNIPTEITNASKKEIIDMYLPVDAEHPRIRIRKNGDKYTLVKKVPIEEGDASRQEEHTVVLTAEEFGAFSDIPARKLRKIRYSFDYNGYATEVDLFADALEGLVLVDFEFSSDEDKNNFVVPDFCLADVTQEDFIAGGMLAGKTYEDITSDLARFGYTKLAIGLTSI